MKSFRVQLNLSRKGNLQGLQSMSAENMLDTLIHTSLPVLLIAMYVVSDEFEMQLPISSTFKK